MAALVAGGNASSVHKEGRAARAIIERARRRLAERFGVAPDAVTFTSGGTEASAMALSPGAARGGSVAERLLVSAIEHPAVLAGGRFAPDAVARIPVLPSGVVDLAALEALLAADPRPALVSLMAANNETGVIQPLAEAHRLVHAAGGILHSDAVQGLGRLPEASLTADLVTISGHKIGAPMGVGALIRRGGTAVAPLIRGGGQERGARGGTENVAAIAGFDAALDSPAASPAAWADTQKARDRFEAALVESFPGAIVFGRESPRLANTSLFAPGATPAELALIGLDLAGVALSSGSACSSGKVGASHVLAAMGVPEATARSALRISLGPQHAERDLVQFLMALREVIVPMEQLSIS